MILIDVVPMLRHSPPHWKLEESFIAAFIMISCSISSTLSSIISTSESKEDMVPMVYWSKQQCEEWNRSVNEIKHSPIYRLNSNIFWDFWIFSNVLDFKRCGPIITRYMDIDGQYRLVRIDWFPTTGVETDRSNSNMIDIDRSEGQTN
jgi:hypothetical protein